MGDQEILMLQLGKCYPEDKSLSPIEVSKLLGPFFEKRGLSLKVGYIQKHELTQELISRIKKLYEKVKPDIKNRLKFNSERQVRNKYFEMVYVILDYNHFGIANKNNKLIKISCNKFANIFGVRRNTLSKNQLVMNFYLGNRYKIYNCLEEIFYEIERNIL